MPRIDRPTRPLPTSLATLAALVAILAAASSLPDGAVIERSRGWIIRPIDGDEPGSGGGRSLTDCLAQAARHLLGARAELTVAIAPLHLVHAIRVATPSLTDCESRGEPPARRVLVSHLALPPPLA